MENVRRIFFVLVIFLFVSEFYWGTSIAASPNYPDNVKQVNCYRTNIDSYPWGIRLASSSDVSAHEYYTPLVGDLNADGVPEIVVTQSNWVHHDVARLVVFSGNDLSQSSVIELNTDLSYYSGAPYGLVRVPDLNNPQDTIGLIVVRTVLGLRSYKFDNLLSITEFKNYVGSVPSGPIAFADFNNDGHPEVYVGNSVFDAYSLDLIGIGSDNSGAGYLHQNVELISYAADIIPSLPGTELICGSQIYTVDVVNKSVNLYKSVSPPPGFSSDGQIEVADFDGDGQLDVLVKQNSTTYGIYAYNPLTGSILFSKTINVSGYQNYPMIGDIDADGSAEIILLYPNTMNAYKYDGTTLQLFWSVTVNDISGSTGMTLFDFNQDGLKEIVYRDAAELRIINGSRKSHLTGTDTIVYNLSSIALTSTTVSEFPVVADCDMDGEAEIIATGIIPGDSKSRLHVFKSLNQGSWAPARPVWNQYAYNITNINQNLTVPPTIFNNATFFTNGTQPFNNFQEQATTLNQNGDMFFEEFPDTLHIDTTITRGDSYTFGSKVYKSPVKDTLRLKNMYNCDSTVILNLSVIGSCFESLLLVDSFCIGNYYEFNNKNIFSGGVYNDTLFHVSPDLCDTLVSLSLLELNNSTITQFQYIYDGQTYEINGHQYRKNGIYRDTLKTVAGCDSIVITNLDVSDCNPIEIPLYFSPNDDGFNDIWKIKNMECHPSHRVEIYDRFGKLLIKKENNFQFWDGYYLDILMPSDDYWYLIYLNNSRLPYKVGHFTLMR